MPQELCIRDETAAADRIRFAAGARMGINGAPDGTHPIAVGGVVFFKSTDELGNGRCINLSADPTEGSVSVPANGTATITTSEGQRVVALGETNSGVNVNLDELNDNDFILRNNSGGAITVDYGYW